MRVRRGSFTRSISVDKFYRTTDSFLLRICSVAPAALSARPMDRMDGTCGTLDAYFQRWNVIILCVCVYFEHDVCTNVCSKRALFKNGPLLLPVGTVLIRSATLAFSS